MEANESPVRSSGTAQVADFSGWLSGVAFFLLLVLAVPALEWLSGLL